MYDRVNNPSSLQGNNDKGRDAFVYALAASKAELKRRKVFSESVRAVFSDYTSHLIDYYSQIGKRTLELQRDFYAFVKTRLIPDLYDSPDDFMEDSLIRHIYESSSFEEFLFLRLEDHKAALAKLRNRIKVVNENTVSIRCMDYRIGHALLALPRAILHKK